MSAFTIRELRGDDWRALREIRLEALRAHPEFFCPSRDEEAFSELDWRARLDNPSGASFGLYHGDEIIGLTGIVYVRSQAETQSAHLVSSYIKEGFRGRGLSRLFYKARIDWAQKQRGISTIIVEHREDNIPSQRAHQGFGFEFFEAYPRRWPDGSTRPSHVYHLKID